MSLQKFHSENVTRKISFEKFHSKNFTWKISFEKFHSKNFTQKIYWKNFTRKISIKKFHGKNFTLKILLLYFDIQTYLVTTVTSATTVTSFTTVLTHYCHNCHYCHYCLIGWQEGSFSYHLIPFRSLFHKHLLTDRPTNRQLDFQSCSGQLKKHEQVQSLKQAHRH